MVGGVLEFWSGSWGTWLLDLCPSIKVVLGYPDRGRDTSRDLLALDARGLDSAAPERSCSPRGRTSSGMDGVELMAQSLSAKSVCLRRCGFRTCAAGPDRGMGVTGYLFILSEGLFAHLSLCVHRDFQR